MFLGIIYGLFHVSWYYFILLVVSSWVSNDIKAQVFARCGKAWREFFGYFISFISKIR